MFSMIIHGRGGQGAKTFALILAETAIDSGRYAQAFPEFGPERTGAPVRSFLRIDSEEIITHEPITDPDTVVVLDESLLLLDEVLETLANNPLLIINSSKEAVDFKKELEKKINFFGKIQTVDAAAIVADCKAKIHPTTPIAAKIIKQTEILKLDDLKNTYEEKFTEKLGEEVVEETLQLMDRVYHEL